jgi:CHAD domain-containing protein
VRSAISRATERLLRHDPTLRSAEEPENVHQARVATRRLRSDLRTLGSLVDQRWGEAQNDDLRWLANTLGAVRDLDVRLPRLEAAVAELSDADRPGGDIIVGRTRVAQKQARAELTEALRSERYYSLVDRLVAASVEPPATTAAGKKAAPVLRAELARVARKLRKRVDTLGHSPPDEALHRVRIDAKRLRYAAELAAPVLGKPAASIASAAAGLQTVLGERQDAAVNIEHLREHTSYGDPVEAYAAGLLVAKEMEAIASAHSDWRKPWKRVTQAVAKADLG